jgi:hypothetical protein
VNKKYIVLNYLSYLAHRFGYSNYSRTKLELVLDIMFIMIIS